MPIGYSLGIVGLNEYVNNSNIHFSYLQKLRNNSAIVRKTLKCNYL